MTLDFLVEAPGLPRRFFSVRWDGFWYAQKPAQWQWKLVYTSYALSISSVAVTGTLVGSNRSLA